ncbi:C-type lectin domain family 2 member E-like isoform X1 [Aquarana catesbeiana]|uniref:C-type lectin domain family 2 member E-like isoform X1 n=1 Tax=Aquarana catesbeiana TaxID=8400 RepID=UPI003CCA4A7E
MTDEHRVRRLQSRKIVTKTQWSNKDIFICPIREITVEEEHRGFVISKTKPEILQDLSRYGTKKHISESVLYIILTFALINIVIVAALWTVYSARGKAPERIYVQCMDDWVLYRGKCYYFSDQIHTWKNSQNFCKSNNSSLAIIDNEKEMKFLNLLSTNKYWIGLSRAKNDSGWVGTDGTFYSETISYITRLADPGESEHVYLNGEGFKSGSGRYPKKWICSKRLISKNEHSAVRTNDGSIISHGSGHTCS